jgi:hypothetical protein
MISMTYSPPLGHTRPSRSAGRLFPIYVQPRSRCLRLSAPVLHRYSRRPQRRSEDDYIEYQSHGNRPVDGCQRQDLGKMGIGPMAHRLSGIRGENRTRNTCPDFPLTRITPARPRSWLLRRQHPFNAAAGECHVGEAWRGDCRAAPDREDSVRVSGLEWAACGSRNGLILTAPRAAGR